jgi:hypothetical protein
MLRVDRASRAEKRAPVVIEWLPIAHYPRLLLGHFIQEKLPLFPGIRDPSFVRILAHGLERIERPNGGQSELILWRSQLRPVASMHHRDHAYCGLIKSDDNIDAMAVRATGARRIGDRDPFFQHPWTTYPANSSPRPPPVRGVSLTLGLASRPLYKQPEAALRYTEVNRINTNPRST